MHEPEIITFDPWPDPAIDPYGQDPNGDWSRLAWLPIIGPSSWLVCGTLAAQLRHDPHVTWGVQDLAAAHGLHGTTSRTGPMRRTVARLCQFRLVADTDGVDRFVVRLTAPPLFRRQLSRLPVYVAELQRQIFQVPRHQAG
ncbi:MAG: hypothetical protein ACRD29_00045 [Acidimicrobiales bacterium]